MVIYMRRNQSDKDEKYRSLSNITGVKIMGSNMGNDKVWLCGLVKSS